MTYTKRNADAAFPECLLMIPGETPMPDYVRHTVRKHNEAVNAFFHHSIAGDTPRRSERAILSLATGIDGWIGSNPEGASDGYGAPNVTVPLLQAFSDALNFDLGRLDGATLSEWCAAQYVRCGLNPDTGDFA